VGFKTKRGIPVSLPKRGSKSRTALTLKRSAGIQPKVPPQQAATINAEETEMAGEKKPRKSEVFKGKSEVNGVVSERHEDFKWLEKRWGYVGIIKKVL